MTIITRTLTVIEHQAEEGGYWAEVLELPGCVSQGETREELRKNIREAIEAVSQDDEFQISLQFESIFSEFRVSSENYAAISLIPVSGTGTWTEAVA